VCGFSQKNSTNEAASTPNCAFQKALQKVNALPDFLLDCIQFGAGLRRSNRCHLLRRQSVAVFADSDSFAG
jgi:hypothetical protein